jgi:hypothetical protein
MRGNLKLNAPCKGYAPQRGTMSTAGFSSMEDSHFSKKRIARIFAYKVTNFTARLGAFKVQYVLKTIYIFVVNI